MTLLISSISSNTYRDDRRAPRDEYGFDVRYDDPRDYDGRNSQSGHHDAWDPRDSRHDSRDRSPKRERFDDYDHVSLTLIENIIILNYYQGSTQKSYPSITK